MVKAILGLWVGGVCERSEHGKSQLSVKYFCTIPTAFLKSISILKFYVYCPTITKFDLFCTLSKLVKKRLHSELSPCITYNDLIATKIIIFFSFTKSFKDLLVRRLMIILYCAFCIFVMALMRFDNTIRTKSPDSLHNKKRTVSLYK